MEADRAIHGVFNPFAYSPGCGVILSGSCAIICDAVYNRTQGTVIPVQTGIQVHAFEPWIPAFKGTTKERRYEYDGLNLLRVDERYDTGGGAIDANDPWRTLEVNSHRPGALGALSPSPPALSHHGEREPDCASGQSTTPSSTTDYVYVYDAVGNLYVVLNDEGGEAYAFCQDAWGITPGCPSPRAHKHP